MMYKAVLYVILYFCNIATPREVLVEQVLDQQELRICPVSYMTAAYDFYLLCFFTKLTIFH